LSEDNDSLDYLPPASGPGLKIPILFGAVIALAVATVYLYFQLNQVRTEMASVREAMIEEVSGLRETSTVTSETQERRLESMREELETAQEQASAAAGQARIAATRRAEELAQQLAAEQARQREEQQRVAQVAEELSQGMSQVSEATDVNTSTLGEVQTQVAETQSELERTIESLNTVTGDLGVQSGLIATNGQELAALRELGDRDYFEFDITKTNTPVKVGDIGIRLRDTNRDRGRFTLDVVADDKTVRKRARTVQEPLQFYVSSARQPYELVVNEVYRNRIVGYLAVPKAKIPREATTNQGG